MYPAQISCSTVGIVFLTVARLLISRSHYPAYLAVLRITSLRDGHTDAARDRDATIHIRRLDARKFHRKTLLHTARSNTPIRGGGDHRLVFDTA